MIALLLRVLVLAGVLGLAVPPAAAQPIAGGIVQLDTLYARAERLFEPGPVRLFLASILDDWAYQGVHVYALQLTPAPVFTVWFLVWNLGAFSAAPLQPIAPHYLWEGPFSSPIACDYEKATWQMYHSGPLLTVQPVCLGLTAWP